MSRADDDRRSILFVLAGAGRDGLTVREMADATGLAVPRIHELLKRPRADGTIVGHPGGKRRRHQGRWCSVWVRADVLLDEVTP